jgi:hypothetical protein
VRSLALGVLAALLLGACSSGPSPGTPRTSAPRAQPSTSATPTRSASRPAHLVVVVEENHSYGEVIGNPNAPYLNRLAKTGRSLTNMHATRHPSQPNYLALFSGSPHGITDDSCPHTFHSANLGRQLLSSGHTFVGYSQGLPSAGSKACDAGSYARKHAPWVNFANLPAKQTSRPFRAFPTKYATLPTVSFVIPNLDNDMHDGTIAQADKWLKANFSRYASWARHHHSQLIVTWDENDGSAGNHIATMISGAAVKTGKFTTKVTTYSLLRLIEQDYGLKLLGSAASAPVISLR